MGNTISTPYNVVEEQHVKTVTLDINKEQNDIENQNDHHNDVETSDQNKPKTLPKMTNNDHELFLFV